MKKKNPVIILVFLVGIAAAAFLIKSLISNTLLTDNSSFGELFSPESNEEQLFESAEIIDTETLNILNGAIEAANYTIELYNSTDDDPPFGNYLDMVDTVYLTNEFRALFDPEKFSCGFNEKLKRKIKDKEGWLPPQIGFDNQDSMKLSVPVLKFKESSAAYIFNLVKLTYKYNDGNGMRDTTITTVPEGSLLFNANKALQFINDQRRSFIVNFDCDGYYRAAISAGLGGSGRNIKANASTSKGQKASSFVGMAYVHSPLQYIMEPATVRITGKVPQYERFSHLASILALARSVRANDFEVQPSQQIKMVWASNSGTSNFNTKADISAAANLGVVSGNASGGISIKKGASYNEFESYLVGVTKSPVGKFNKSELTNKMKDIFASIEMEGEVIWQDKDLTFAFKLNEEYCNKASGGWRIQESGYELIQMTPDVQGRGICSCIVEGDINAKNRFATITGEIEGQLVKRVIELPLLN